MEDTGHRYSQLRASTSTMAQVELRFDWRMSPHILRARASHPHADALHFLGSRRRARVPMSLTSWERGRRARIAPHILEARTSRPHCPPLPASAGVSPALPPTSWVHARRARVPMPLTSWVHARRARVPMLPHPGSQGWISWER